MYVYMYVSFFNILWGFLVHISVQFCIKFKDTGQMEQYFWEPWGSFAASTQALLTLEEEITTAKLFKEKCDVCNGLTNHHPIQRSLRFCL